MEYAWRLFLLLSRKLSLSLSYYLHALVILEKKKTHTSRVCEYNPLACCMHIAEAI